MPSNFRRLARLGLAPLAWADRSIQHEPYALSHRHFALATGAALALHLMAWAAWYLAPSPQVIDVPVRALNIKLGDEDVVPESAGVQTIDNSAGVENIIARMVRDTHAEIDRAKAVEEALKKAAPPPKPPKQDKIAARGFDRRAEGVKAAAPVLPVARQYVRDLAPPGTGSTLGESAARNAEILTRYEQLISLWIKKFQTYPAEAHAKSIEGETVIRIRIDRRGNIRYYALDHTTGSELLDRAALDMVLRANPVPPVPADYPPGESIEFKVPVRFRLHD